MVKDGTNRGGRRVRAGAKPGPLGEKLAAGRPATRLEDPLNEPFDVADNDIGDGAVRAGETMPEPSDYLSEIQRDGKPLGADLVYRETWQWLDQRGCSHFVAPRLIEAYAQAFARYVQCEQAISKFGLLGKHPTTGAAIASPFVAMSQSFGKQANVYWYEIDEIMRATCTTDYAGTTPGEEVMAAGRRIIVTGEITTNHRPRIRESVRTALARAGYSPLGILIYVWTRRQSSDINAGVTTSLEARGGDSSAFALQGAGDQGTVYGYATAETHERLPLPLVLAHRTCERLDTAQVEGTICGINPDGKAQVSVRYDDTGTLAAAETVGSRCSMRRARIWPCWSVRCAR